MWVGGRYSHEAVATIFPDVERAGTVEGDPPAAAVYRAGRLTGFVFRSTKHYVVHGRLWALKWVTAAALLGPPLQPVGGAVRDAGIEPFRTVFDLRFRRGWPNVAWALALLAASAAGRKFICRYPRPPGAALAVPAKLKIFDGLRRRKGCGRPCQARAGECEVRGIRAAREINPQRVPLLPRLPGDLPERSPMPGAGGASPAPRAGGMAQRWGHDDAVWLSRREGRLSRPVRCRRTARVPLIHIKEVTTRGRYLRKPEHGPVPRGESADGRWGWERVVVGQEDCGRRR